MKTQTKDYYRLLGVRPDATVLLIKKAYRKLAKQYHPDVNDSPDAADRFREITEAYDTLTDPDRRRRYDRLHGFGHTTSGTDDGSSRYYRTRDSTRPATGQRTATAPRWPAGSSRYWKTPGWRSAAGTPKSPRS